MKLVTVIFYTRYPNGSERKIIKKIPVFKYCNYSEEINYYIEQYNKNNFCIIYLNSVIDIKEL